MNGAELLVQTLRAHGVEHLFGLPGDTGMAFYDALYHEPDITHVMTRDERSASFMADVYARVANRLGICEGPSGGGATYSVPGVAEAHGSAVPVLCLTSDTPVSQQHRNVLTELDQVALFRPVTGWAERVLSANAMGDAARRAIRMAISGRPGASHLSLPEDSLENDVSESVARQGDERLTDRFPLSRPRADSAEVDRAARMLVEAHRPVIVVGGGVHASQAYDALAALAEGCNIPVATSINGKGAIAETSLVSIGVVGANGARSYANAWVAEADLVFFIGTRTDSTTTGAWTLPSRQAPPKTVHLDVAEREIGNTYPNGAVLLGDARATLEDLLEAIGGDAAKLRQRHAERIAKLDAQRTQYFDQVVAAARSEAWPMKPQRVVHEMREVFDDDIVIVADPGTPTPYLGAQFPLRRAGRTTVIPRAHGGLGYALPGVVGAAYAAGNRRVIGMMGDGSFGMSVGELETISRLNLPVVMVQTANQTFGWIKELQHLYHGRRYYSVDFNEAAYADIARGFGVEGVDVQRSDEFAPALQEALASGKPTFINVQTEPQMTETPPVAPWEASVVAGGMD
ncbi:MAG: thiamine pyrophosphate-binding protein [Chloroflexota bacterium]|nr:thiamine pyrophosphate-binding protein [Chloroflexota bacterium]